MIRLSSYPEIGNANFKCTLWTFKIAINFKICECVVEFLLSSYKLLWNVASGIGLLKFSVCFQNMLLPSNEVWGKVMFLQVFCLSTGGQGLASQHVSQVTWLGVCLQGGLHPGEGVCIQGDWGSASRGLGRPERSAYRMVWGRPPIGDTWNTTAYGQPAGSTHHTGMHSC